jgi:hypothetical protein
MRSLAAFFSIAAMSALAAGPVYELTLDASLRAADGQATYVSDEQLREKIPELADIGERIDTCVQGMKVPMSYIFTYAPTVFAPHQALTNIVQCEGNRDDPNLLCRANISQNPVVFDEDSRHCFVQGPNTDRGAAIEVFRAFNEGRILFSEETKPWIKGLQIRQITQEGSTFVVMKADCGCNETVAVERGADGTASSFVAIKKLQGMCI